MALSGLITNAGAQFPGAPAEGANVYHSRTGGGGSGVSPCRANESPVWLDGSGLIERVQSAARLAIECIGNSAALYHNVEHTMLVTLVGFDILRGRQLLLRLGTHNSKQLNVACLPHDIG